MTITLLMLSAISMSNSSNIMKICTIGELEKTFILNFITQNLEYNGIVQ